MSGGGGGTRFVLSCYTAVNPDLGRWYVTHAHARFSGKPIAKKRQPQKKLLPFCFGAHRLVDVCMYGIQQAELAVRAKEFAQEFKRGQARRGSVFFCARSLKVMFMFAGVPYWLIG